MVLPRIIAGSFSIKLTRRTRKDDTLAAKPVRTVLTIVMDLFIVVAIALTIRMVVAFFGALASQEWGGILVTITDRMTLPLGIEGIKTPYGGVFDVEAAITIAALLVIEWLLSVARARD